MLDIRAKLKNNYIIVKDGNYKIGNVRYVKDNTLLVKFGDCGRENIPIFSRKIVGTTRLKLNTDVVLSDDNVMDYTSWIAPKIGNRLVKYVNGCYYIGTITNIRFSWFSLLLDNGKIVVVYQNYQHVVGVGIDKKCTKPIPECDLKKWVIGKMRKIDTIPFALRERAKIIVDIGRSNTRYYVTSIDGITNNKKIVVTIDEKMIELDHHSPKIVGVPKFEHNGIPEGYITNMKFEYVVSSRKRYPTVQERIKEHRENMTKRLAMIKAVSAKFNSIPK